MARGKAEIKSLFYITHIENVPSILAKGILSHAQVEAEKLAFTPNGNIGRSPGFGVWFGGTRLG